MTFQLSKSFEGTETNPLTCVKSIVSIPSSNSAISGLGKVHDCYSVTDPQTGRKTYTRRLNYLEFDLSSFPNIIHLPPTSYVYTLFLKYVVDNSSGNVGQPVADIVNGTKASLFYPNTDDFYNFAYTEYPLPGTLRETSSGIKEGYSLTSPYITFNNDFKLKLIIRPSTLTSSARITIQSAELRMTYTAPSSPDPVPAFFNNKFSLNTDGQIPNIKGVPELCLGPSNWWVNANDYIIPLIQNYKDWPNRNKIKDCNLKVSVIKCNTDLTRESSGKRIDWTITFTPGSTPESDFRIIPGDGLDNTERAMLNWFDLKRYMTPEASTWFEEDGVYELWLWIDGANNRAVRYFHVSKNQPTILNTTYSVNHRSPNITITNSVIQNNYQLQVASASPVDIVAQTEIAILPGTNQSALMPNTQFRVDPSADCNNLQNGRMFEISNDEMDSENESMIANAQLFIVMPNPSNGIFTVSVNKSVKNGIIKVYDLVGHVLEKRILDDATENHEFDISSQNSGVYIIQLISSDFISTERIVKK